MKYDLQNYADYKQRQQNCEKKNETLGQINSHSHNLWWCSSLLELRALCVTATTKQATTAEELKI